MFDRIFLASRKTYIHKNGQIWYKVESSYPTEWSTFPYFISRHVKKHNIYTTWKLSFLNFLVQIDFPRIINFLIFVLFFSFISTFYMAFYSTWVRSNNIVLSSVYIKIYLTHIIISVPFLHSIDYISIVLLFFADCMTKNPSL